MRRKRRVEWGSYPKERSEKICKLQVSTLDAVITLWLLVTTPRRHV